MWKDYSLSYIKNNRAICGSIIVATLISAIFLSLITSLFYNIWQDDIHQTIIKEGDWQAKITDHISDADIARITSVSNVKYIKMNQMEDGKEILVYFKKLKDIYADMALIANLVDVNKSAIQFHESLLSKYLILAPGEKNPPLLLPFYILVMILTCIGIIMVVKSAFQVTMHTRIHQLGLLKSIGATPGQIRTCLFQEVLVLCVLPIITGTAVGAGLCLGLVRLANEIAAGYRGRNAHFSYHFGLFAISCTVSLLTVLYSAWLPAGKLSKMDPLTAVNGAVSDHSMKKVKKYPVISFLFGVEGELACKSLYQRRKALRISTLSLLFAFMAFSFFLSFATLSGISTKYTYFERYKNDWDIMVTVSGQKFNEVEKTLHSGLTDLEGDISLYQKVKAYALMENKNLSNELNSIGGLPVIDTSVQTIDKTKLMILTPVIILDDQSFLKYCDKIGLQSIKNKSGTIVINRIWDSKNSNFRYKKYIPFLKENATHSISFAEESGSSEGVKLPILAFTDQLPELREEYADYSLVQIVSQRTILKIMPELALKSKEIYINVKTDEKNIHSIQTRIESLLNGEKYTIENRVDEEQYNNDMKKGYQIIIGGICGLLALVGLANVFANTLGFMYQREREFARYMSIGMTPYGLKKILCMEALFIAGRPIVITIPATIIFSVWAANASFIDPVEFFQNMPYIPLLLFAGMIFSMVSLAYFLGGRKIGKKNMIEILKNDILL